MIAKFARPVALVLKYRRDDEPVLAAMPLKPGSDPAMPSRFGDDRWNLHAAIFRENLPTTHRTLDFSAIADPLQRLTAKEYLWARLNERRPGYQDRLAPSYAYVTLRTLRPFMTFVQAQTGAFILAAVDQDLLDAFLADQRRHSLRSAARIASCSMQSSTCTGTRGCSPKVVLPVNHGVDIPPCASPGLLRATRRIRRLESRIR